MSFEIQEDPTKKTSGLTSAMQIIDVTDDVTFSEKNTSSETQRTIALEILHTDIEELRPSRPDMEKQKFRESLKKSIERNINILKELSKY